MLDIALEASTSSYEQLCKDSYTLAQVYIEWRLESLTEIPSDMYELLSSIPTDVSRWIVQQGGNTEPFLLDTFPEDVYAHCMAVRGMTSIEF